jgi:hypothetical protein
MYFNDNFAFFKIVAQCCLSRHGSLDVWDQDFFRIVLYRVRTCGDGDFVFSYYSSML